MASVQNVLENLQIPADFARYDSVTDAQVIAGLELWKTNAQGTLLRLHELVRERLEAGDPLSAQERSRIVSTVAAFDGDGQWITEVARESCKGILGRVCDGSSDVVDDILANDIRPIFRTNSHPSLNVSTGRKLARPAGGPMASQDYYQSQTWKQSPGAANVISWCVRNTDSAKYEKRWHLIIPPAMTYLDDYEAAYKLRGVRIVGEMLQRVPPDLLRRTGVDELLYSSLTTCLNSLNSPDTPNLLHAAVLTLLVLIELTTTLGSSQRFDRLCAVLGDHIIGGVWMYAYEDLETILATVEVLPEILDAMGLGCARYLKALIPQLVYPLLPNPLKPSPVKLQLSSARALCVVVAKCGVHMQRWKDRIVEAVGKCWVTLIDAETNDDAAIELKRTLQEVCVRLREACPSIMENEYKRLVVADAKLFEALVCP